ncbi:Major facilitator superfamily domain general substrate transporter [Penicillium cf. griseofulvum]|uniref:Major facilitator superfamily domain general substrate transporter n=1 Tax=Penicillium cf. griseofulvum TaxID=2972120 RepID=A0A9W9J0N2_9EURO|nr:Major facilitator superfamily domain general substrate transporter [Penicillium cf. griseofulvum]KAJ5429773.1 Major facilitator superfamily domain general substrate transporter [Penicillium cf. griseofulvum]KAJ5436458.1 Major facilitator superfamily domain general substrate transporter [Penicillium cf. griseofulvum]
MATSDTAYAEAEMGKSGDREHIEEIALARVTEEDLWKMSQDSLSLKSRTGFRLFLIMFIHGCNQAGFGIDWGVIGGINAMQKWHDYFGFESSGGTYGLVNALMQIGTVCGAPFMGLADVFGRRAINFGGNAFVIFGALMQGLAVNLPMFMAGRFFLGFGSALMSSSQYIGEVSPIHLRGVMVGFFGACFQVGSLAMLGAMIGLTELPGNNSWRVPLILECLFPAIVCLGIYFLTPESPRYYVLKGNRQKAKEVIAKYHTTSADINEPIVEIVVKQIEESLEADTTGYRAYWDYRVFFTKTARFRLLVLILYSLFQQWNGGGIITYYMTPSLQQLGFHNEKSLLGFQIGTTAVYFVFTAVGALIVDRFRRRTMIFVGLISMIIFQTATTITSWRYTVYPTIAAAACTILWIFLYQTFSATFVATMHNLYPIEILSLPLRAKGMGVYSLIQGGAGAAQTYGIGVGIQKVGYKIWVVYIVYNSVQLLLSYLFFPETSSLSLEEINTVFETPGVHPVKMSLDIQKAKKARAAARDEEGSVNR